MLKFYEDYKYQDKIIRAGVIYTRLGDTNIPLTESASEAQIELMWRERFGFGLAPLQRVKRLLDDLENWVSVDEDNQIYHQTFPEFTICQGKIINEYFSEAWTDKFPNPNAHSFEVELRYFETLIYKETFVMFDERRYRIPLPKIERANSVSKYFIKKDDFAYKIAKIFRQHSPIDDALETADIKLI